MNYLQAHYCTAFAHSVPAYITYCYGTELFASGELTPQDMDGIMYEMHKAYFKYREQKREKERIMNL